MLRLPERPYMVWASASVGCCSVMWFWMLVADLKAMGQLGHLWNNSQWACWMWDLTELSPPNTTRQLEHLQGGQQQQASQGTWLYSTQTLAWTRGWGWGRGVGSTPVSDTARKVQTRLIQVCLKQQLVDRAPALWADVRFAAAVDALVSCGAAAVGQEHRRGALGAGLERRKSV